MSVDDLFETDIALIFDGALSAFERWVYQHQTILLQQDDRALQDYIAKSIYRSEFRQMAREWIWLLNLPERDYCPRITVFAQCFHQYQQIHYQTIQDFILVISAESTPHIFVILTMVARQILSPQYKRIKSDIKERVKQRERSIKAKIDDVVSRHSRILPIRFDLYYHEQDAVAVSSVEFQQHILKFSQEMKNPNAYLFSERDMSKQEIEILFYSRIAEQGRRTGHFHAHFLVILNGKYHVHDHRFIQGVKELWEKVTTGQGYLRQHRANAQEFKAYLDINGKVIQRDDRSALDSLYTAAMYTAKWSVESNVGQYLRIKSKGFESFACSHMR